MQEFTTTPPTTEEVFDFDAMMAPVALPKIDQQKSQLEIQIRNSFPNEYLRTNSDFEKPYWVLEGKKDGPLHLVNPILVPQLEGDVKNITFVLCINRDGEQFIMPCKSPSYPNEPYATTRLEGVEAARSKWIRIRLKNGEKGYVIIPATGNFPDPIWPAEPFKAILTRAFGGRYIMNLDHPVLKRLRGEI